MSLWFSFYMDKSINHLNYVNNFTEACQCERFISDDGYGNCLKNSFNVMHRGRPTCYVTKNAKCKDLMDSKVHPGKKYSADACEFSGLLNYIHLNYGSL